jgi:hypothetical protein
VVIGTEFVWGHLPKTGGDATARLFGLFPELAVEADAAETHAKHALFSERQELLAGKRRALNLRRLPTWILSVSMFQALYGDHPTYQPMPMRSPREMARSRFADENLLPFVDGPVHHWLRMEHLGEDFLHFLSAYTEPDHERRAQVLAFGEVNAQGYDHVLSHWFTEEHIEEMYESNPAWTAVERALYGDLLTLAEEPMTVGLPSPWASA